MLDEIRGQLDGQLDTMSELEEELEMEISRVISLKNKFGPEPELIEDLEKIEEGLYVEVKMIHETKKTIETILDSIDKNEDNEPAPEKVDDDQVEIPDSEKVEKDLVEKQNLEKYEYEIKKFKKREEKLVKQLIQANEEIEEINSNMESNIKTRERELKNELMNKLKDKERLMNEKLFQTQRNLEELMNQLESYKRNEMKGNDDVDRVKSFFDKKIKNIKLTMSQEFKQREKEIAKKAIMVLNKKKENIYQSAIQEALELDEIPPEVYQILGRLREVLGLAEDVYVPENYSLCSNCGDAVHVSRSRCPNCHHKM